MGLSCPLSLGCWTVYWLMLSYQTCLPSWSACLVQGTQEDGQVWQHMGTAQAKHLTYSMWLTFLFPAPVALLQQLFRDSWRISVFTIIFPVLQSTVLYLLPIHTEHSNSLTPNFEPFSSRRLLWMFFPCLGASFFFIGQLKVWTSRWDFFPSICF